MKTIVLLSGGLDSAVVLAACVKQGDECIAIGFDYGQDHKIELEAAKKIAGHYGVPFEVFDLPPIHAKVDDVVFAGRNLVFAAIAIAIAQAEGIDRIAVGCNATDWPRFPDCRPAFWQALEKCGEAYEIAVIAPLLYLSKRDVVEQARRLSVPIELTWSCYSPRRVTHPIERIAPCDVCLACKTRQEALQ